MPRRHGQRKKGSSKQQKAVAATPTLVEDTKVAAIEEKVVAAVAAPVKAASPSTKGRLRQVVESEKVEKVVSYLSSYAPTLLSIYGNVKDRLPETLKSNVEQIEQDYVVPASSFTVVKCDQMIDQVDETLNLTESRIVKTVEQTKEVVSTTVEKTKQKVRSAVTETLSVGMDTIEKTVDYALPSKEEGDEKLSSASGDKALMERVSLLNSTLQSRLQNLALVAAIHEKKELATAALKEKYASTESLLKERYVAIDKVYLKPAVKFVNEQYVVLDSKYFQPAKAYVSDKYVLVDTKFIEQFKTFAETSVLYPTKEFVKGLSQELKWTQRYTSYIPEATQVKEYVAYGYKTVQSNVLLPTASYLGVDETFVSYEKMVLDHVSRVVDPYVSIDGESKKTLTQEDVDGAIIDDAGDALAVDNEDWQDAPVKPSKFEPIYPSDEE